MNKKEDTQQDSVISTDFKNALKSAENYSKLMHMSKASIYEQLTSEYGGKFTYEDNNYIILRGYNIVYRTSSLW